MGKIIELIKSFINPAPEEKSLKEVAAEAGLNEEEINELSKTSGGMDWIKFSREDEEENKKEKGTKKIAREVPTQSVPKTKRQDMDLER